MRRHLTPWAVTLVLLVTCVAGAQTYPPELAGGVAVVESQPIRLGLVELAAPVGVLPWPPWWTISAQITADGDTATLTTAASSHTYPWNADVGSYQRVYAVDATHLRAEGLIYHGAGAWSWVTADLAFTGSCCPWWDFDPAGWFLQFATVAERQQPPIGVSR